TSYGCFIDNQFGSDQYFRSCRHDGLPSAGGVCSRTFPSQEFGVQEVASRTNVTEEAQWRAIYTANQMRQETPVPTYIYVIGLGSNITDLCTSAFLSTLANDPDGPAKFPCPAHPPRYDASLPPGLFLQVPNCPSPTCTQSLSQAFQVIAGR